jgi:hypothetical protein
MFGKDTAALDAVMARLDEIDAGTKASIESLRNRLDERLDQIALQASTNKDEVNANLLEVVTAITTAFMTETIEIKQGVEAIVDALSTAAAAAPAAAEPAAASGTVCAVKGCGKPATVVTSWKMDILTPAEDVSVCEPHAEMMAKQAFQAPKGKAAPPAEPPKATAPDREEFAKEYGIGEGAPDESILTPEPLDPITAAIEASFRAGKSAG